MAPHDKRVRKRRRPVRGAAALAVSAALAAGLLVTGVDATVLPVDDGRAPGVPGTAGPAGPAAPAPPAPAPGAPVPLLPQPPDRTTAAGREHPPFGVFLASDQQGVERMARFSQWLGGAELTVGHTYLPGVHWSDIEGRAQWLESWAGWRNAEPGRMFVLNVPMQARNEEGVPDHEVRELLRRGAAGEFDHHFRTLAERLVRLKVPDTVIVLGWEMNGTTYTHRCGPDPQAWKTYWRRIVTAMRAVPGQKFRFDFTPNRGRDAVPWTECYPGDDVVDILGMDSYDQPSGISFDEQVSEPYGLRHHVEFARAHRKPVSYPEWGLFRNGDNPEYMRRMLSWIAEHRPVYNTLTDYCPHGVWQCETNPRSAHVYRSVLSGRHEHPGHPVPTPTPTAPTLPPGPAEPPNCSVLDLGDWVEHWLGGRLCIRFTWW